ncbi:MAG: hypothetical protein AAFP84_13245 [Actinomycetota bacterium]
MQRTRQMAVITLLFVVASTACGSSDDGSAADGNQTASNSAGDTEPADPIPTAADAGTLTFRGEQMQLTSTFCLPAEEGRLDITAIDDSGFRVQVSGDVADPSLQIVTPDPVQWFDGDPFQQNRPTVTIDGRTFSASGGTWFNNVDDELVEASFTLRCDDPIG